MYKTGEPMYELIAEVYRDALGNAQDGQQDAIEWLDMCAPDWREMLDKPKMSQREVGMKCYRDSTAHWQEMAKNGRNYKQTTDSNSKATQ